MSCNIALSADSACDFNNSFKKKFKVDCFPFHIHLDGKEYKDGVDINPKFIFEVYKEKKLIPKTSAISVDEYESHFASLLSKNKEVIHVSLSGAVSSTYKNALKASERLSNIYVVNSCSLSFGIGILIMEASYKIAKGINAKQILEELNELRNRIEVSFIVSTLDFINSGGRCPSIVTLGLNFFNIKPCIKIDNKQGKMKISKIYRGKLGVVLPKYIKDKIKDKIIANSTVFLVHSGIEKKLLNKVKTSILKCNKKILNIVEARTGCAITSHCGPETLGIAFLKA
ncbi:MAG: DegV family EDD domain-containing protein [Oscillospiraceae bacterium]|jgi:DegV family protein with EDD domain|nr:DegV family EDD domain-containing protein [Oscillospiraceae bacterium]